MTAYEKYNALDELVSALENALDALDEVDEYDEELATALSNSIEYYAEQRDGIHDEAINEQRREQHEMYMDWVRSR